MRILLSLFILFCLNTLLSQVKILSNNSDGSLSVLSINDCSEESYLLNNTFSDIAITPNNNLYAINGGLFKIDYLNSSYSYVGPITDINNRPISPGTGLTSLDDNFLLIDSSGDSLFKVSTATAKAVAVGKIGYICAGDFAILNDTLYMIDWGSHLIKIILNSSKTSILLVIDVGLVNINFHIIYSLFTAYPSCNSTAKELFCIVKNSIYKLNTNTAVATFVCSMNNNSIESYGATSSFEDDTNVKLEERMPNVFTPNGDNINDSFSFTKCDHVLKTTIYNRWGNEVFNTEKQNHFWDGRTTAGEECVEGTYFYVLTTAEKTYKGAIQLMR